MSSLALLRVFFFLFQLCNQNFVLIGRFSGKLKMLDQLLEEVKEYRPGSELLECQGPQRRVQRKKTTIKQLFTAASKFQKNLRR